MNQHEYNKKQIDEMLSDTNKYYFWKHYGRAHQSVDELAEFYVQQGGAKNFAQTHNRERLK